MRRIYKRLAGRLRISLKIITWRTLSGFRNISAMSLEPREGKSVEVEEDRRDVES